MKKGLSEAEALQKVKSIQSKASLKKTFEKRSEIANESSPYKIETWIKKGLSQKEAEFEVKSRRKSNIEYWQKRGFSVEESKLKVSEFQTSVAKNSKPDDCVPTQLKYWIKKGYDEESAKKMLSERQATFTLEKCISKYGEIEGTKKWEARQLKWKESVFNDLQWIGGGKSKISDNLFTLLNIDGSLYGKNERFIRNDSIVYKYDFCVKTNRKIIEFNGDYWHCNPKIYSPDFYHTIKRMNAQEIWDHDKLKESVAISKGYDYLVIWESEYKLFPEETINKCKEFLCS